MRLYVAGILAAAMVMDRLMAPANAAAPRR